MERRNEYSFALPSNIVHGWGAAENIPALAKRYHAKSIFILSTPDIVNLGLMSGMLDALHAEGLRTVLFDGIREEPPLELPDEAAKAAIEHGCDLVIGFGGGSVIDTMKAVALLIKHRSYRTLRDLIAADVQERGVPTIAVPTTAGTGSEVTKVAIFTDTRANLKVSLVSSCIVPDVAVVDPRLTVSLPPRLTAYTGIDALTHAIESYLSRGATPMTDLLAAEAIRLISRHLADCVANNDPKAREAQAFASLLAGMAFANAGVGAAHALAYPLGGRYHLTHGLCVGMLMPAVMNVTATADPERVGRIAEWMGCDVAGTTAEERAALAVGAVSALLREVGFPANLKELGVEESSIREMTDQAIAIDRLLKNCIKPMRWDDVKQIYDLTVGARG